MCHIVTWELYQWLNSRALCHDWGEMRLNRPGASGAIPSDPRKMTICQHLTFWDQMGSEVSRLGSHSGCQKFGELPRFLAGAACVGCAFVPLGRVRYGSSSSGDRHGSIRLPVGARTAAWRSEGLQPHSLKAPVADGVSITRDNPGSRSVGTMPSSAPFVRP